MSANDWTAVDVERSEGHARLVLVCEHAAREIPPDLAGLGLDDVALQSHIAWDIGARDLARGLSARLDAPLVSGRVSRLVYDLNRPLDAGDAMPSRSEVFAIPGNRDLDDAMRADRHHRLHVPFHAALADTLARQDARTGGAVDLISVHSFTPVFEGHARQVQIGFLCHEDDTLARAALAAEKARGVYRVELNQPYGPADGVTHTLATHGDGAGRRAMMIEVANDLVADAAAAEAMAEHLTATLRDAMSEQGR